MTRKNYMYFIKKKIVIALKKKSTKVHVYLRLSINGTALIDGFANDVDDATQRFWPDWNTNRSSRVVDLLTPDEPLRAVHGDCSYGVLA